MHKELIGVDDRHEMSLRRAAEERREQHQVAVGQSMIARADQRSTERDTGVRGHERPGVRRRTADQIAV